MDYVFALEEEGNTCQSIDAVDQIYHTLLVIRHRSAFTPDRDLTEPPSRLLFF